MKKVTAVCGVIPLVLAGSVQAEETWGEEEASPGRVSAATAFRDGMSRAACTETPSTRRTTALRAAPESVRLPARVASEAARKAQRAGIRLCIRWC